MLQYSGTYSCSPTNTLLLITTTVVTANQIANYKKQATLLFRNSNSTPVQPAVAQLKHTKFSLCRWFWRFSPGALLPGDCRHLVDTHGAWLVHCKVLLQTRETLKDDTKRGNLYLLPELSYVLAKTLITGNS
jgi:hypothetical protein